jgi:hypothetical protein
LCEKARQILKKRAKFKKASQIFKKARQILKKRAKF